MVTTTIKLVTIITEGILEGRIIDAITRLGAKGYTLSEVRGHGTSGISGNQWYGPQVRIETLVGPEVADRILHHLQDHYFTDYSMAAYVETVEVVRSEKYL
ncbi:MAG: transcriptional regulator [Chloroflexales bacterium]|nr:transcriptional regulator [Chloroflexales bacterium]